MQQEQEPVSKPPQLSLSPSTASDFNAFYSPPFTRESSPSPSISPTPALYPCPPLSRSFSASTPSEYSSSASTISQPSVISRSSSASAAVRQRGYVRPQGATFAPSAGNRDSVLSLGSIAHLQYYFARTGLLEGKGGRAAQDDRGKPGTGKLNRDARVKVYDFADYNSTLDSGVDSVSEAGQSEQDAEEPYMLPPTVSTYSHRVRYIPPPPDSKTLRQDLLASAADAKKGLQQVAEEKAASKTTLGTDAHDLSTAPDDENGASMSFQASSGWHEIQGLHILDVVTLAIRAAKIYYTSHEEPQRLYGFKSERKIREELLNVLDVLKRMASRNFAGGIRDDELKTMCNWVEGIKAFISHEEELEKQEIQQRAGWTWLEGEWKGIERIRERMFLNSFNPLQPLPLWTSVDASAPKMTPFLECLQNGLILVHLHNALLKKSKRQFGEIKTFHTDTSKPYRCAENLRYWIKAAEIRWEVKLTINVSAVANGRDEAWLDFDAAVFEWSRTVREELSKEWGGRGASAPVAGAPEEGESPQRLTDEH